MDPLRLDREESWRNLHVHFRGSRNGSRSLRRQIEATSGYEGERSFILCPILFPQELQQSPMLRKRLAAERRRTLIGDDVGVQHFSSESSCANASFGLCWEKMKSTERSINPRCLCGAHQLSLRNLPTAAARCIQIDLYQ